MPPKITVKMPRERLVKEDCKTDDYLLNQLDGINDNPEEDGLPLRQWLIQSAHEAIVKNPKLTSVDLKPRADKSSNTVFCIEVPLE